VKIKAKPEFSKPIYNSVSKYEIPFKYLNARGNVKNSLKYTLLLLDPRVSVLGLLDVMLDYLTFTELEKVTLV